MSTIWVGESNGCWVDLFDEVEFKGKAVRLWGPNDFPLLRIGEAGSQPNIRSVRVGHGAYLQIYEDLNFDRSVVWMLPNQTVKSTADLKGGTELDSIRLFDRPPFAREPGYSAYMSWAAHHIEHANGKPAPRDTRKLDGMH